MPARSLPANVDPRDSLRTRAEAVAVDVGHRSHHCRLGIGRARSLWARPPGTRVDRCHWKSRRHIVQPSRSTAFACLGDQSISRSIVLRRNGHSSSSADSCREVPGRLQCLFPTQISIRKKQTIVSRCFPPGSNLNLVRLSPLVAHGEMPIVSIRPFGRRPRPPDVTPERGLPTQVEAET